MVKNLSSSVLFALQYVNRAFLELSGYSIEEVIGQPALDIMKPFDAKQVRERGRKNVEVLHIIHAMTFLSTSG